MVKLMKKLFLFIFLIPAFFLFTACNDPIFYNISHEEKKLEPKIQGSPTNFAVFNGNMYVASGRQLYKYNGTYPGHSERGNWDEIQSPGGRIFELAAANNFLYVLFEEPEGGVLRTFNGISWGGLPESSVHNIRSIHSINDKLFTGAGEKIDSIYILYYDYDEKEFKKLQDTGGRLLNGAAYANGKYYLSTKDQNYAEGGGIYSTDLIDTAILHNNIPFLGIINFNETTIYAIDQNGNLYNVIPNISKITDMGSYQATGSLSIWENGGQRLLLAGRKDKMNASVTSGYTYGYLELIGSRFDEPGKNSPSTVNNGENNKYNSTIGKYPISHMMQSPKAGEYRILFASTQKEGVWSYRQRDTGWHWNAEQ
jgi:hypothetical protein